MTVTQVYRKDTEYSTGMKQALAIARGLIHDPCVILMDEPTRSLSYEASQRFYGLVRAEAEKGKAVLFASHNLAEVGHIADSAIVLGEGMVQAAGAPKDLGRHTGLYGYGTPEAPYGISAAELP